MPTTRRLLTLCVLLSIAGCDKKTIRPEPTALSGPMCTARLRSGEQSHCDPAPVCSGRHSDNTSRCTQYDLTALTDPDGFLGSVKFSTWLIRPKDRRDADLAGRVPLMFSHGMGMNDGWAEGLAKSEALADRTGRPILYIAEFMVANSSSLTSQTMTLKGRGDITGSRSVDDVALAGANVSSWTWEGAVPASDWGYAGSDWILSAFSNCRNQGRLLGLGEDNRYHCYTCPAGTLLDSSYMTGLRGQPARLPACYKQRRAQNVYVNTAPWALQMARKMVVSYGHIPSYQQWDVFAHSAGAIYIAAAIANHNGAVAGDASDWYFTNFHQYVRNVVSSHGMHLGVIDEAKADAIGFRSQGTYYGSPARPNFINQWKNNARFAGVHWWAIRYASCARDEPSRPARAEYWPYFWDSMAANYVFGFAVGHDLGDVTEFCGGKNHRGDKVVPTRAQASPWVNSHGFYENTCGRDTWTYRQYEYDCSSANWIADKQEWKGNHRFGITTAEGLGHVLTTLESACLYWGASCQYEQPCYTGPAGTQDVGECHGGVRFTTDPGTCRGEVTPSADVCDVKDNDCDGAIDEDGGTRYGYPDLDRDGHGAGGYTAYAGCPGLTYGGWSDLADDCNDRDARVHPAADSGYQTIAIEQAGGGYSWDFNCDGVDEPHCNDGSCQPDFGEDAYACHGDCGWCGDGLCTGTEDLYSCANDCGYCGDGICGAYEDPYSCSWDCGMAGNGQCRDGSYCDNWTPCYDGSFCIQNAY